MARQSETTGFRCPRPGCGGKCGVDRTTPSETRSEDKRKRHCRRCGHKFLSTEVADPMPLDFAATNLRQVLKSHLTPWRTQEELDLINKLCRDLALALPILREIQRVDWEYIHPETVEMTSMPATSP